MNPDYAATATLPLRDQWVRRGALLAGAIFFSGALGVESVAGVLFDDGGRTLLYVALQTVEEGLEFFGVALMFLVAYQSMQRHRNNDSASDLD